MVFFKLKKKHYYLLFLRWNQLAITNLLLLRENFRVFLLTLMQGSLLSVVVTFWGSLLLEFYGICTTLYITENKAKKLQLNAVRTGTESIVTSICSNKNCFLSQIEKHENFLEN